MSFCRECNQFMLYPDSHRCPPAFICEPAETEVYGEGCEQTILSRDAEGAAEKYADQWDCEGGDYSILRGSPLEVKVTGPDGEVTYWEVTGESLPTYYAQVSTAYPCDSGSGAEREDAGTAAEAEGPQSGGDSRIAQTPPEDSSHVQ